MKNFSLGVFITLTLGLFMQNISLREQLFASQQIQKSNQVIVKKNKPVKKNSPAPQVAKQAVVEENTVIADNSGGQDPRCPSHLPYYTSYWGCVVKRP
jgi:hypothetical protein